MIHSYILFWIVRAEMEEPPHRVKPTALRTAADASYSNQRENRNTRASCRYHPQLHFPAESAK